MWIRNSGAVLALTLLAACGGGAGIADQGCLYGYCFVETRTADRGSGPIVVGQLAIPMEGQNDGRPIVASGAGESFVQGFFKGTGPALALGGFSVLAAAQSDPAQSEINQTGGGATVGDVSADADAEGGDAISVSESESISGSVANAGAIAQNKTVQGRTGNSPKKGKRPRGSRPNASINQGGCVNTGFCSN